MNIEQAKAIPLSVILDKMGLTPQRTTNGKINYFSPYRKENTPSFYIYTKENRWYDYGDNRGGDTIDLVRAYLESCGVNSDAASALRWTRNMTAWHKITPVNDEDDCYDGTCHDTDPTFVFKKAEPITKQALIYYGESRGIAPYILKKFLEQVFFLNKATKSSIFALGMRNESKGYDLRNPNFKGCIRQKDVTFIRGSSEQPTAIHIFEGMMDFLSIMTQRNGKPMEDDVIVLHSLSCMEKAAGFITGFNYHKCYTWLDNDLAGQKANESWAEFCGRQEGLHHVPMNKDYEPYKDVNAWHMAKLELK